MKQLCFTPERISNGMGIIRDMKSLEYVTASDPRLYEFMHAQEFWNQYDSGRYRPAADTTKPKAKPNALRPLVLSSQKDLAERLREEGIPIPDLDERGKPKWWPRIYMHGFLEGWDHATKGIIASGESVVPNHIGIHADRRKAWLEAYTEGVARALGGHREDTTADSLRGKYEALPREQRRQFLKLGDR